MAAVSASTGGLGVSDLVSGSPPVTDSPWLCALAYDSHRFPSIVTALPLILMPLTNVPPGVGVGVDVRVGVNVAVGVCGPLRAIICAAAFLKTVDEALPSLNRLKCSPLSGG